MAENVTPIYLVQLRSRSRPPKRIRDSAKRYAELLSKRFSRIFGVKTQLSWRQVYGKSELQILTEHYELFCRGNVKPKQSDLYNTKSITDDSRVTSSPMKSTSSASGEVEMNDVARSLSQESIHLLTPPPMNPIMQQTVSSSTDTAGTPEESFKTLSTEPCKAKSMETSLAVAPPAEPDSTTLTLDMRLKDAALALDLALIHEVPPSKVPLALLNITPDQEPRISQEISTSKKSIRTTLSPLQMFLQRTSPVSDTSNTSKTSQKNNKPMESSKNRSPDTPTTRPQTELKSTSTTVIADKHPEGSAPLLDLALMRQGLKSRPLDLSRESMIDKRMCM
ncbi:hypothetical protein QAD02_023300 [Eretmocerus hayati]|uniref:Uncharacterized protein n=1 Tax=Eretmocerus hayati TaxID=131215 RepID=A0ACC2PXK3_9HYME|nr:hypothetical protein QAD02_023300 [Eretmocerus hayati]